MTTRFPTDDTSGDGVDNPAIRLYGRRFHKDQTPVEYLAEFLLVFASPKGAAITAHDQDLPGNHAFSFSIGEDPGRAQYWPADHIALKLFTFFPSSTLGTRHDVHQRAYAEALDDLRARIDAGSTEKEETIRLLQSLFAGFVGVSGNRTWATYSFLPASASLLSREVTWLHTKASRQNPTSWEEARTYFATDRHIFMARGGELLFLQLAHLFQNGGTTFLNLAKSSSYAHLKQNDLFVLQHSIEQNLSELLRKTTLPLNDLSAFVESALSEFRLFDNPRHANLGWVPTSTEVVAGLFAIEINNILRSSLSNLEKIESLQNLCCLHVLRTLCYLASHEDISSPEVEGFAGNYTWITANNSLAFGSPSRKLSEQSFADTEQMLYRVLRANADHTDNLNEADKHGFQIFRKLAKELGLVVPRTGKGQRFVLPPHLLHFLVIALIEPGKRIPLDRFYERVFAHFGIALGPRQLAVALSHRSVEANAAHHDYAIAADTSWIEETLRQGDFLVELSDAVSIVRNPSAQDLSNAYSG